MTRPVWACSPSSRAIERAASSRRSPKLRANKGQKIEKLDASALLKLTPKRTLKFTLADGTAITRDVSECRIRCSHGEGHTPVILGKRGDKALLGAVTLEILGLVLNPFSRELQPMQMMLA